MAREESRGVKGSIRTTRPNTLEVALGSALEWAIQRWTLTMGRQVHAEDAPWLAGPVGKVRIGAEFYEEYAQEAGLETVTDDPDGGCYRISRPWRAGVSMLP